MRRKKQLKYILSILLIFVLLMYLTLYYGIASSHGIVKESVFNYKYQSLRKHYTNDHNGKNLSQNKTKLKERERALNIIHNKVKEENQVFVTNIRPNSKQFVKSSTVSPSNPLKKECKKRYQRFLFRRNATTIPVEEIVNIPGLCDRKPQNKTYKLYRQTLGMGLGNQMFFYASAKSIALKSNRTFIHRWRDKVHETFNLDYTYQRIDINEETILSVNVHTCCAFFEGVYNLPEEDIRLEGFLQSWKYLNKTLVKQEFQFKDKIVTQSSAFIEQVKILNQIDVDTKLIGIHVRRGDMLTETNSRFGHTIAGRDYIIRAMKYYENKYKCHFIVASSDINWCKENLLDYENKISYSENNSPGVDMSIISQCDHVIITVGTFGWWAAYLSNGEVVYYKDWPRKGSAFDGTVNKGDYFPPHWLPL